MFGRPDIGAYLKDTFSMRIESRRIMDECGLETSEEMDVSAPNGDLTICFILLSWLKRVRRRLPPRVQQNMYEYTGAIA